MPLLVICPTYMILGRAKSLAPPWFLMSCIQELGGLEASQESTHRVLSHGIWIGYRPSFVLCAHCGCSIERKVLIYHPVSYNACSLSTAMKRAAGTGKWGSVYKIDLGLNFWNGKKSFMTYQVRKSTAKQFPQRAE